MVGDRRQIQDIIAQVCKDEGLDRRYRLNEWAEEYPVTPENAAYFARSYIRYWKGLLPDVARVEKEIENKSGRRNINFYPVPHVWMPTNARFAAWDGDYTTLGRPIYTCWDAQGRQILGCYSPDGVRSGLPIGDWSRQRPGHVEPCLPGRVYLPVG